MGKKINLSKEETKRCHAIIHAASVAAGGVGTGLAQVPVADHALIIPIQTTMIISLGAVFDQKISESVAKAIISSAGAAFIGRGISQVLFGWVPIVGNTVNTATAAGLTEAIGWYAVKQFVSKQKEQASLGEEVNFLFKGYRFTGKATKEEPEDVENVIANIIITEKNEGKCNVEKSED